MTTNQWTRRLGLAAVVVALLAAACGSEQTEDAVDGTSTGASMEASSAPETSRSGQTTTSSGTTESGTTTSTRTATTSSTDPTRSTSETTTIAAKTTTTSATTTTTATTATAATAVTTTIGVTTTTRATTVPESVDETQARRLAANYLYSVPSATHICSPMGASLPDGFATYVGPARGGDIYALCVLPPGTTPMSGSAAGEPLPTSRVELFAPDGVKVVDVELDKFEEIGRFFLAGNTEPAFQLAVTYPDGSRRAHGVYNFGAGDVQYPNIALPFFLPHDRPTGRWSFGFQNERGDVSGSFVIDAPCGSAVSSASLPGDVLDWPADSFYATIDVHQQIVRSQPIPPPFSHCRIVPEVSGHPITAAIAIMTEYASVNGYTANVTVDEGECPDGIVDDHTHARPGGPGSVGGNSIYRLRLRRQMMGIQTDFDSTHWVLLRDYASADSPCKN